MNRRLSGSHMNTKRMPFYVAVHEAGHLVADWLLGGNPYYVRIEGSRRRPGKQRWGGDAELRRGGAELTDL